MSNNGTLGNAGKPLRAVLYGRVSTEEQAEHGTSIESQKDANERKARDLGATVVRCIDDAGVSGAKYTTRPGLIEAIRLIESGEANLLIAAKLDRVGRSAQVILKVAERVDKAGGELVTGEGISFGGSAVGRLMLTLLAAFAEFERNMIRERTMSGKRTKARQGIQSNRSMRPYGYHIVTKTDALNGQYTADQIGSYVVIEDEARWIREVFCKHSEGLSLAKVCEYLNESGVPTPRNGDYWRKSTIKRILENPVYKGTAAFGRHKRIEDESRMDRGYKQDHLVRKTAAESWMLLPVEPLVSEEVWNLSQERLANGRALHGGNPDRKHMLTGFLRCPACDRAMRGYRRERKSAGGVRVEHYYHCPDQRASRNPGGDVCNPTLYKAAEAESVAIEVVKRLCADPAQIDAAVRAYMKAQRQTFDPKEGDRLRKEIAAIDRREKATVEAQITAIVRGRSAAPYEEALTALHTQRTALEARLRDVEAMAAVDAPAESAPASVIAEEVLRKTFEVLDSDEFTPAEKHDDLAVLIESIRPREEGEYEIRLRQEVNVGQSVANVSIIATISGTMQVEVISCDTLPKAA